LKDLLLCNVQMLTDSAAETVFTCMLQPEHIAPLNLLTGLYRGAASWRGGEGKRVGRVWSLQQFTSRAVVTFFSGNNFKMQWNKQDWWWWWWWWSVV